MLYVVILLIVIIVLLGSILGALKFGFNEIVTGLRAIHDEIKRTRS